ncbi:LysR family transcriptional regulator [Rhizobacter sp. AJA081-3]|jgi:DNA-binding transcriptional LysR family regulator|uniref:LysR family transcriptional regulator n=1 Tax=Rhizobacter sp. AJA081-3 TaxID=2753607 RepID=UPI001AE09344|nr:LysR family transcriptional regulator [Rhizobacter sp. AJA081-3]QTN25762.1 LysR family transcriptional regulator [Rhizobacter sp. AJA081-3]
MELADIDLNQLVLFQQLMVERRVSKVAENLGLTQPAVSNTLAKLRRQFGDDLFVRTPAGMVPTPFAEQLAEPIGYALGMIHSGLNQHSRFDPASVKRSVTIGMTDIGEIVFLPRLVERLRQEAPGVSLITVRTTATSLRDDMEAGKVDLAIGPLPQLKAGFFQRRLFRQRYVCLFRKGHPLDRKRLSLADFKAAEHLVIVSAGTGHGKVDDLIRRAGVERAVRLTVPHFVSVGHILRHSDMVATVTERLADSLVEPFDLTFRAHPVDLPEIAINLFWHAKVHRSPAHQWLRGVVFDLFGEDRATAATSSR